MKRKQKRARTVTTLKAASAHTGIGVDTLKRLRDSGCDGFASSGRINVEKVLAWITANPDAIDAELPDYGLERALLTRAERKRKEIMLEVDRGRLIDVQEAKRVYAGEVIKFMVRISAMPRRQSQRLAMESDPIKVEELLTKEINEARQDAADGK